ncbi:MAG: ATP-binding cassette domain-containing protein [Desulfovibrionaceae bacterium]
MPTPPPLLELRHVTRTFSVRRGFMAGHATVHAVDDVSLSLHQGQSLGLVGESGCGKSTLGRLAVGLLEPSSGTVLLDGLPPRHGSGGKAAGRLQMVFQDPFSSLNPRLSVGTSIGEPLLARGIGGRERRKAVDEMLELVGLSHEQGQRFPHEFSGGQRQRVAVARALITRPDVVVCDEPVSALDASVQAQILNLLQDVQERFGPAYLFISHDLAVVGFMCEHIQVMYLGKIVERSPRQELFDGPAHPYTQALFASMPTRQLQNYGSGPPIVLQGELPSPLTPPSGCPFHPRCPQQTAICQKSMPDWTTQGSRQVRCHLYS